MTYGKVLVGGLVCADRTQSGSRPTGRIGIVLALFGSSLFTAPPIAVHAQSGPIASYSFDTLSGSQVPDSSGNGNTLSVLNGGALTTGKYSRAMSFDGGNDVLVADASKSALNLNGAGFTLSAWINPRSNSAWQMIVNKPYGSSHTFPYFDWSLHRQASSGRIALYLGCDNAQRTSNATTPINAWTHVAITYDRSSIRHYINGVLDRTTPVSCSVTNGTSQRIRVGANRDSTEVMNGVIDDVRIYDRVLTAAEIQRDAATPVASGQSSTDTTAPTTSITSPAAGATVSGAVMVAATASDAVGVVGVQLQVDGQNAGAEDLSAPYSTAWNSSGVADGSHALVAVARDSAGNRGSSSPVVVNVRNQTGAPTVSISANPTSVTSGGNSSLNWWSTNASSCQASGAWSGSRALSGSAQTAALTAPTNTFTLTCTGTGGSTSASATVSVASSAPAPTLSLTANPTSVASGARSTLTWTSANATSCAASGAWSGSRPSSGSETSAALTAPTSVFTLACSGAGGSVTRSVTVSVQQASGPQSGLDFPSNGDAPANAFVAFQFDNPQNNGLPLWGPSGQGATYMWKYRPRQQNGYYVTFWWSQADGFFNGSAGYYGAHPYPNDGHSLPPLTSVGTHNWEIAIIGWDIQQTRSGQNKRVIKGVWYTQALRVVRTSANSKTLTFYTALPSTAPGDVIEYTVTSAGYGESTPPTPKITFGDSPWYPGYGHERLSGVVRGIKIFNRALSEGAILAEAASDTLVTAEGQANIWYMNINPTPSDISDKSGKGHNPSWAGSERAKLWSGP